MEDKRRSGVLLHPTSLPGAFGIGDLGPQAYRWIDFLHAAGCGLWQVLPLGPTGYMDSPYQCFSGFAGNHLLISPELLLEDGLLTPEDLAKCPDFPVERVDYGLLIYWKEDLLDRAYQRFGAMGDIAAELEAFESQHQGWLGDYALFMALKRAHGGAPWVDWQAPLRQRQPEALEAERQQHAPIIRGQVFRQFVFHRQWARLREYANAQGVRIIGDIPIYVAHDSADVWAHPEMFYLDEVGQPTVVAGVPPDYFSPTGQLWGYPIYRWDLHQDSGFQWWLDRVQSVLNMVDCLRLDHFRGFAGYWEVPAGNRTAERGRWVKGPGRAFFHAMQARFGELPVIAEDLGEITPDVVELRDHFQLPGMKVFQFGFVGPRNHPFLPHTYPSRCVAYTGTHDNDTARGWYQDATWKQRWLCRRYLGIKDERDVAWSMLRTLWASQAAMVLAPMQDFLNLDSQARMNYPGRPEGNWAWRMRPEALSQPLIESMRELNRTSDRDAAWSE